MKGTVAVALRTPPAYTADTEALNQDGGTDTLTPVTEDGIAVAAGAYVATIDSTGTMLTVDATLTTAAVTITRILGLQQTVPSDSDGWDDSRSGGVGGRVRCGQGP